MPPKNRNGLPAYQRIQNVLRKCIESGGLHPGDGSASERDLAKESPGESDDRHAMRSPRSSAKASSSVARASAHFVAAPKDPLQTN